MARATRLVASIALAALATITRSTSAADLSAFEREVRGFIQGVGETRTIHPLALKATYEKRGALGYARIPSAQARTEVTPEGEVSYNAGMLGSRVTVDDGAVEEWLPAGTAVQITGFTAATDHVDFGLRRPHAFRQGPDAGLALSQPITIRILPGSGDLDPVSTLRALSVLVDLGPSLQRLESLAGEYGRLEGELATTRSRLEQVGGGDREALQLLRSTLAAAVRNRQQYGELVRAKPLGLAEIEKELRDATLLLSATPAPKEAEVQLATELAGLLSQLARLGEAPPPEAFTPALEWGDQLSDLVSRVVDNRRRCAEARCDSASELVAWQSLAGEVDGWLSGVRTARRNGCAGASPRSLEDVENDSALSADFLVAKMIRSCGVSFRPGPAEITRLARAGAGELTTAAFREPNAYRISSTDLALRVAGASAATMASVGASLKDAGVGFENNPSPDAEVQALIPKPVNDGRLLWTSSSLGVMPFVDAQERCRTLTLNGLRWRVPTIEELQRSDRTGLLGQVASSATIKLSGCCVWSNLSENSRALAMTLDDGKSDWVSRRLGQANAVCVADQRPAQP